MKTKKSLKDDAFTQVIFKNLLVFTRSRALLFLLTLPVSAILSGQRPNILYFYVDDLGWGSIGPNGQERRKSMGLPHVQTPNLDRLAKDGINFTRGYGCTVCSPARSSQQTGFHQGYTFADRNDPDNAKKAIREDDITMGDALSRAGYVTGYWGKWGYGGSKDMENPIIENVQTLPNSHGYKFVLAELHHVRAHTFFQPTLWNAPAKAVSSGGLVLKPNCVANYRNNKSYSNYPAFQNHSGYPSPAYCDDLYAFACLDFVRTQAKEFNRSGRPFFGLFAAQIPHAPFDEVEKLPNWDQDYKNKSFFKKLSSQSKQWCAMVTRIDAHFGNILAALEDPNADGNKSDSVAENTLVVFQSDNGGPKGSSREELDANGGLLGSKGSINEGGIRVPTIMRWPKMITPNSKLKRGSKTSFVMDCSDLLPTFCDLAEVAIPLGVSGVSLAPTLTGKGKQRIREFLIHETKDLASIIRGRYKFIRPKRVSHILQIKNRPKKRVDGKNHSVFQLYDLQSDPFEKNNLAKDNPQLVSQLNSLLTRERVDEPVGFANTYHTWKGPKGGEIHLRSNWTEYVYENAGQTYLLENGSPKAHWCAKIDAGVAKAVENSEFLALSVASKLIVGPHATVHAKNELRVLENGKLVLKGGTVESMRWVEVQPGGTLLGHGVVKADLLSTGTLALSLTKPMLVKGMVELSGSMSLLGSEKGNGSAGHTVLVADSISGGFINNQVSHEGKTYTIFYSPTSVTLKRSDQESKK